MISSVAEKALLNELDRKALRHATEERIRSLGEPGYRWLWALVQRMKRPSLSGRQLANILQLLVNHRFHGEEQELLCLLSQLISDDRTIVRTAATRLLLALRQIRKESPTASEKAAIGLALEEGLENKGISDYVRNYLQGLPE